MTALGVLPPGTARLLPGSSRSFGPPRRWATWEQYRQQFPEARWIPVFPETRCVYPRPDASRDVAERLWRSTFPELGVAVIPNGRVVGADGWPVGNRDTLLVDLATGLERPEYTAYLVNRCRLDASRAGRALNLGTVYARDNYCHFLLDALPRLELFLRAGLTFDDVDWILAPAFIGSSRDAFIRALGLPAEKVVLLEPGAQWQFRELFQPSFPGRECFLAPWIAEFYRERLLKPHGITHERRLRLYVARSQRGIANDAEVWAALKARGFVRLEPATWEDNVRAFASAELIVGPHGAGLSNVVFSPPGAQLIELLPGDRPFPYFYTAAAAAGLSYRALLTTPLAPAGQEYRRLPSDEAYPVSLDALLPMVDAFLERAGEPSARAAAS